MISTLKAEGSGVVDAELIGQDALGQRTDLADLGRGGGLRQSQLLGHLARGQHPLVALG
ncbi:hypothetical protein ACFFX0_09530 [Citricoccus parietis]|uniref:Uncharacterized protein n=1 Tax=Citricoccus parietis TaxID=592307 RepID=A0ABV5FXR1_9MICC